MADGNDQQLSEEMLLRKRIAENAADGSAGAEGEDNTPATAHFGTHRDVDPIGVVDRLEAGAATSHGSEDLGAPLSDTAKIGPDAASVSARSVHTSDGEPGTVAAPGAEAKVEEFGVLDRDTGLDGVGDLLKRSPDAPRVEPAPIVSAPVAPDSDAGSFPSAEVVAEDASDGIPEDPQIKFEGISENEGGAVVGQLEPSDGEYATFITNDARFEVVDGNLKLRQGGALDHEAEDSVSVKIQSVDAAGVVQTETTEVPVLDVNEAPTAMTFAPVAVATSDTAMLSVRLGGESWHGNPQYEIFVDGQRVAQGEVTWSKKSGNFDHDTVDWRDVSVEVPRGPNGIAQVEVRYPNDAYGGDSTRDRNLLVDRIELDGHTIEAEGSGVEYKGGRGATERMAWKGSLVFDTREIEPLATPTVGENDPGAVVGRIDVVDPDIGETFTYTVSDPRFEVADGVLKLIDGIALDHEQAAMLDLRVEVTDSDGHVIAQNIRIAVGDVNESPVEVSLEGATILEAEIGASAGRLKAFDPEGGVMNWSISDDRFEVDGDQLRLRDGVALDYEIEPRLEVEVTATDQDGNETSEKVSIDVQDVAEVARPMVVETGFRFDFFDHGKSVRSTEEIDWDATPTHRSVGETVDFGKTTGSFREGGASEEFAVRVSGQIDVDVGGTHAFRVFADDGVRVFVDGVEVVEDDRPHAPRYSEGSIDLEPGVHHVEIRYFENRGDAALRFEMRGPDEQDWSLVQASDDFAVEQSGSIPLGIDLVGVGELHSVSLHGLPHGSVVMDDGHAVISDGGPVDLSGWNNDAIEVSPPSGYSGTMDLSFRASGRDGEGKPFESVEPVPIKVLPGDEQTGSQYEEDVSDGGAGGWTEALEGQEEYSGNEQEMPVDAGPQHESGDEHMHGYDHGEI